MHYFVFTSEVSWDSYEHQLYCCDHIVNEDEWLKFKQDKNKLKEEQCESLAKEFGKRSGLGWWEDGNSHFAGARQEFYKSPEYEQYKDFCKMHCAKDLFIKAHNMVELKFTELSGD